MSSPLLTILMYHEILGPGARPARSGVGYMRYVLSDVVFREHLGIIQASGAAGTSLGMALGKGGEGLVVLTFDDGCASDARIAAPHLKDAGFGATFFVTVSHLDTPGFMTRGEVIELANAGFEIASHGLTHAYLSDLSGPALIAEVRDSKMQLEALIGRPVHHLSCPGGRWSPAVADVARRSGYLSVADSRPLANPIGADPFRLGRCAITSNTTPAMVARLVMHGPPSTGRIRSWVLAGARAILGNRLYDRARALALGDNHSASAR